MGIPIIFRGVSGAEYSYAPDGPPWPGLPTNYMFGKPLDTASWLIAYIGETGDASDRFPDHERWAEAVRVYGAIHVLTHLGSPDAEVRRMEERDLIAAIRPPMNRQYQSGLLSTAEVLYGQERAPGLGGLLGLGLAGPRKKA